MHPFSVIIIFSTYLTPIIISLKNKNFLIEQRVLEQRNVFKKVIEYIKQEIWARMLLYNFCEVITTKVVVTQKLNRKHFYQVNYTRAIRICCFIRTEKAPPDVEYLIKHELLPVRTGRSNPRKVRSTSHISFLYRTA